MRLAVLFSGGKDSLFATYLAMKQGHEINYLVTIFPESKESWMFHHPCLELTKLQAKALGIKQIIGQTKGEKEKELEDLKKALMKIRNKIDGIVSGAIASTYQKSRIDKICEDIGIRSVAPLWQKNHRELLEEEIRYMEIMVTGVYSEGLDKCWLGRMLDEKCLNELVELNKRYGVNLCGEGGEYETFVLDSPVFKKKIVVESWHKVWEGNSGYIVIDKADLVKKQ